nr:hypothetical protein GCM10025699_59550 [Microbacterium flavescens]
MTSIDASSAVLSASSAPGSLTESGGIVGIASRVIDALGEWGVGLLTFIETIFPPIPSELILPWPEPSRAAAT